MSVLTSRRYARADTVRQCEVVLVMLGAIVGVGATTKGAPDNDAGGLSASTEELRQAEPLILSALQDQANLPEAQASIPRSLNHRVGRLAVKIDGCWHRSTFATRD